MQTVINIDEEVYNRTLTYKDFPEIANLLLYAVANGVPLPNGHGRLIDADKAISKICGSSCGCHLEECGYDKPCYSVTRIQSAPTIIEADEVEE